MTAVNAITRQRWEKAQKAEREYWEKEQKNPNKLAHDIADGHHFTAGLLDIRPVTVQGLSVLDIAGGDFPLVMRRELWLAKAVVVDPAEPQAEYEHVTRVRGMAEHYRDEHFDEVWGYNVLQHVMDPEAVMETARECAVQRIRWFDVIDTPVYEVHPHTISATWLRARFPGFRIVRDIEGTRFVDGHYQKFLALVAERML